MTNFNTEALHSNGDIRFSFSERDVQKKNWSGEICDGYQIYSCITGDGYEIGINNCYNSIELLRTFPLSNVLEEISNIKIIGMGGTLKLYSSERDVINSELPNLYLIIGITGRRTSNYCYVCPTNNIYNKTAESSLLPKIPPQQYNYNQKYNTWYSRLTATQENPPTPITTDVINNYVKRYSKMKGWHEKYLFEIGTKWTQDNFIELSGLTEEDFIGFDEDNRLYQSQLQLLYSQLDTMNNNANSILSFFTSNRALFPRAFLYVTSDYSYAWKPIKNFYIDPFDLDNYEFTLE